MATNGNQLKIKWKNIYLKLHTALKIHNKMRFQLKHLE